MNKIKKIIFAIVIALMATTIIHAESTYTITINNSKANHTYEAYQIFKGVVSTDNERLSNITWGDNISSSYTNGKVASTIAGSLNDSNIEEMTSIFAANLTGTPATSTYNSTTQKYTISNLQPGYYLIKDRDNTLNNNNDAYTNYIVQIVGNVNITPKSDIPVATKTITNSNTKYGVFGLNETITYNLSAVMPTNYDTYQSYNLVFTDTLSSGLTINQSSVKVYVGNTEITTGFNVAYNETTRVLTVTFANTKGINQIQNGSVVKVVYNATINNNAVIGTSGNTNTFQLTYSNNPNGTGVGKSEPSTVTVYTYNLVFNKVDEDGQPLEGANFKLEKKNGNTWSEITKSSSSTATKFIYEKLGLGTYKLTEITTPDGFNTIDPIEFTISATFDNNGLAGLNGSGLSFTANLAEGTMTANITNEEGFALPLTGGMGVIIFVVGGLLLIGLAVFILKKK